MLSKDIAIRVSQLSKTYTTTVKGNDINALSEVSFEVNTGEIVGVIGNNGSGKSTLLKILSGIISPTTGEAHLYGKVVSVLEIGSGFHPELTGKENVYLSGQMLGMKLADIDLKFNRIVEFSGIGNFIDMPVKQYSDGMFMRLAFSIIAHLDADILLFDEIMAVGDAEFTIRCNEKIKELCSKGKTVLLVTHELNTALSICTRCILLEAGRIKSIGHPNEVVQAHIESSVNKANNITALAEPEVNEVPFKFIGAEGNDEVIVNSVQIFSDRAIAGKLSCENTLTLQISYIKKTNKPTCIIALLNHVNMVPARIANPLVKQATTPDDFDTEPGEYELECTFPAFYFDPGLYKVGLFVLDDKYEQVLFLQDVMKFIINYNPSVKEGSYANGINIMPLLPVLKWHKQIVNKEHSI